VLCDWFRCGCSGLERWNARGRNPEHIVAEGGKSVDEKSGKCIVAREKAGKLRLRLKMAGKLRIALPNLTRIVCCEAIKEMLERWVENAPLKPRVQ